MYGPTSYAVVSIATGGASLDGLIKEHVSDDEIQIGRPVGD